MTQDIAGLVRKTLGSKYAEQAVKAQVIALARQNLHQPDVLAALVEVLPQIKDKEIRDLLLKNLGSLDTSRFPSIDVFHAALVNVFRLEKERAMRTALLDRLAEGIHQDLRLVPFFIEVMVQPILSDDERATATEALADLAAIPEEIAVLALKAAVAGPSWVQGAALRVADGVVTWKEPLLLAVLPYLAVTVDRELRHGILARLVKDRVDAKLFFPALAAILRTDTDRGMRLETLELLALMSKSDPDVAAQLDWTIANDSDDRVRARARAIRDGAVSTSDGIKAFSCPKCGGQIPTNAGGRFKCGFCGATLELA
jgi:hypothetical protein